MFSIEFLKSLLPETLDKRDEIIAAIMAEKGKAINEATAKFGDYDQIKNELTAARKSITDLQAAGGDAAKLKEELDRLKAAEEQRTKDEQAAAARRALETRFATVRGAVEFIDPVVESAVLTAFIAAVSEEANKGKGDAAIFESLTKDKPYFKSQNPPGPGDKMKAPGAVEDKALTQEAFDKLTATQRAVVKARSPEVYNAFAKKKGK